MCYLPLNHASKTVFSFGTVGQGAAAGRKQLHLGSHGNHARIGMRQTFTPKARILISPVLSMPGVVQYMVASGENSNISFPSPLLVP
jgi:hypothetical protein